jgi:hypothetical protein
VQYAVAHCPSKNAAYHFLLPYNATNTNDQLAKLKGKFICCAALKKLFLFGQKMDQIFEIKNTTNIAPPPKHGLMGKKNAQRLHADDPTVAAVYDTLKNTVTWGSPLLPGL